MKNLALVKEIAGKVPAHCRVSRCEGNGCEVRLEGMPSRPDRLTIHLDCKELGISNKKRCDHLFIGQADATTYVALIELKSGKVDSVTDVTKQLQGGADLAAQLLPSNASFQFRPVLAHGKGMHKHMLKQLRRVKVQLHETTTPIRIVQCGSKLIDVFENPDGLHPATGKQTGQAKTKG